MKKRNLLLTILSVIMAVMFSVPLFTAFADTTEGGASETETLTVDIFNGTYDDVTLVGATQATDNGVNVVSISNSAWGGGMILSKSKVNLTGKTDPYLCFEFKATTNSSGAVASYVNTVSAVIVEGWNNPKVDLASNVSLGVSDDYQVSRYSLSGVNEADYTKFAGLRIYDNAPDKSKLMVTPSDEVKGYYVPATFSSWSATRVFEYGVADFDISDIVSNVDYKGTVSITYRTSTAMTDAVNFGLGNFFNWNLGFRSVDISSLIVSDGEWRTLYFNVASVSGEINGTCWDDASISGNVDLTKIAGFAIRSSVIGGIDVADVSISWNGAENALKRVDTTGPELTYNGELTIKAKVGDNAPTFSDVKAIDKFDGETAVTVTWSDGAVTDGKLNHGTHTVTLTAVDKAGNVSEDSFVITVKVTNSNEFTVSFDPNNGTPITEVIVEEGNTVSKPTNNPEKENYVFDCWTLDGKAFDFNSAISKDITLVASYFDDFGIKLKAINANLGEKIGFMVYFEIKNEFKTAHPEAYIEFTVGSGDYAFTHKVLVKNAEIRSVDGVDCHVFQVKVSATQLTDVVSFRFNDGTNYSSLTRKYTFREYALKIIETSTDAKQVELAKQTLNYGAYAQIYFNYKTDNLANEGIFAGANPIDAISSVTREENTVSGSATGFEGISTISAELKSTMSFRIGLSFEYGYSKDNFDYAVSYVDAQGVTQTVKDFVLVEDNNGGIYIEIPVASQLVSNRYTIKVTNKSANDSYEAVTYLRYYISKQIEESTVTDLKNLCKAMYLYSESAVAYFNK